MTPNWLDCSRGYIVESDHKLIGQVGARLVGGIRTKARDIIKPNHQPSGFRPSIPNLSRRFGKSEIQINFPLGQSPIWVRDVPRANVYSVLVRLGLVSEELFVG